MQITKTYIIIGFFCLFSIDSSSHRLLSSYAIPSDETEPFDKFCPDYDRKDFMENSWKSTYQSDMAIQLTQLSLTMNRTQYFEFMITDRFDLLWKQIKQQPKDIVLYFVFFVAGLVQLILVIPFLITCCCSPDNFPYCCKKDVKELYTNKQILVPSIFVIVLSAIMIGCMVTIFVMDLTFDQTFQPLRCQMNAFINDLTYGAYSSSNQQIFFPGVVTIINQLNVQQIDFSLYFSTAFYTSDLQPSFQSAKENVKDVPDGEGGPLVLTYPSPINQLNPTQQQNSSFPNVLGTWSTNNTVLFQIYESLQKSQEIIEEVYIKTQNLQTYDNGFITSIQNLQQVNKQIGSVQTRFNNFNNQIYAQQFGLIQFFYKAELVLVMITAVVIIFMVSAVCCRGKHSYRHGMYIACWFMYLFAIICFVLCIFFSASTAYSFMGCQYLSSGLQDRQNFMNKFKNIFKQDELTQTLSVCIDTNQSQFILKDVIEPVTIQYMQQASDLYLALQQYTDLQVPEYFQNKTEGLALMITNYQIGKQLYLDDWVQGFDILNNISEPSYKNCSSNPEDSWVPNVQQSIIQCKANNKATSAQCPATDFTAKTQLCIGCMDTYDIFKDNTTRQDVFNALQGRYPDVSCQDFNSQLANIWSNYYQVKRDELGPLITRADSLQTQVQELADVIKTNIDEDFLNLFKDLSQNYSSIVDQNYGIVAGFKCQPIIEDMQLGRDIFCERMFYNSFLLRILFAIAGFAFVVNKYCILMVGRRSFHNERLTLKKSVLRPVVAKSVDQMSQSAKNIHVQDQQRDQQREGDKSQQVVESGLRKSKYQSNQMLRESAIEGFIPYI